ncbi:Multidrug resistance protein [Nesidiocoris tenuis]|uniref:Multidrug resistance protein n=1 Tax=Nesidiocoris tenuis TaxID=355587 RepID=A0ABN7B5X5_9HEMI|nr:Multidrug resistance protein [Nesidiocoris tenuis]
MKTDDERQPLIEGFLQKYGTESHTEKECVKQKQKKYGIFSLFRFASKTDLLLMLGGTLSAIVVGSAGPILGRVFGNMTNVFSRVSAEGFKFAHNSSRDSGITMSSNWSLEDKEPITQDEFMSEMATFSYYYLYIGIATFIAAYLEVYQWELACERQVFKLRKLFFSQVLRQDIEWFDTQEHGDLSSKLSDDLERVREGIGQKFAMVIQYLATLVSGVVIGLLANWQLTCVLLSIAPLVVGSSAAMARMVSGGAAREQLRYSFASKIAEEVLTCIRTVTAFGGEKIEITKYDAALEKGKRAAMRKYYGVSIGMSFVSFITYGSYAFAFWYSTILIRDGTASVGSVFTVFFAVMSGAFGIGNVLPYLNSVSTAIGSADVILSIIDRKPSIDPYGDDGVKPAFRGEIEFKNVHFTYPTRKNVPVLNGLSVRVEAGQTVAFIGSSGAGKSTIVNLLMRFYDATDGQILVDGYDVRFLNLRWFRRNVGVVSQEPVLFAVSVAENIRYGREGVTDDDIVKAAKIANAHNFIEALPDGYNTQVGERGAQLSGGQKQRIAIARALVRDPKILLLDEATSALDAKSETIVQKALDSAMEGRTTLIIAHRLSTIKNSDRIYAMKGGSVMESGTHEGLMSLKGVYYELVKLQKRDEKQQRATIGEIEEEMESCPKRKSIDDLAKNIEPGTSNEKRKYDRIIWRLLKINTPDWPLLLIGFLSCAVNGTITPVFAFFYAQIFATFQLEAGEMEKQTPLWVSSFVVIGVISAAALATQILSMTAVAERLLARLRLASFQNMLKQQISWFDFEEHSSGKLQTVLAKEAPITKSCSGLRAGQILSTICTLIAAVAIACIFGWQLALILCLGVPVLVYASYKQMASLRTSLDLNNQAMNDAGKVASEGVQNVKTVQSLANQEIFVEQYKTLLRAPFKENVKQAFYLALTCGIAQALPYTVYAAAFRFGSYLILIGQMTPADVYKVFFSLSLSAASIGSSTAFFQDLSKGKSAARQLFQIIDEKSEADPTSDDGIEIVSRGQISFEDVHFSYPIRPEQPILRGLNLSIGAGETVALVGESGSGKSTIISLLERFYKPSSGSIKLDGIGIDRIKLSSLRSQLGIVTQEPILFSGTIKYNIAYGALNRELTDAEIIEAAKKANIHNFICSLPLGYETPCGDRGTQMSGGQKQRIAIARALIRNPKILLLDEATSALDVESEKVVQEALDQARIGRTSLIVSHRLSTVQNADKIVVIQNGVVVESGTHAELMESQGFYHQLVKKQQM